MPDRPIRPRSPRSLRSIAIAEIVSSSANPLSLAAIADATGIPKPTLHRLIGVLVEAGVLLREPHAKTYSPGERLWAIANGLGDHASLRNERHAILKNLVEKIGETCNFTTLDGADVVYVDRVESAWPLRLSLHPGSRVPIHCTSSGKLYLSYMPARQRRRLIGEVPLKRYTAKTITDPARLEIEFARIRRSRVSTDDEGYLAGLISVAVPVWGRNRRVIGTVAVHAPTARMSLKKALEHVDLLKRAASDLGQIYRRLK